ncbi:AAA+ ATPase domain-containing protein [Entamoeba marina]
MFSVESILSFDISFIYLSYASARSVGLVMKCPIVVESVHPFLNTSMAVHSKVVTSFIFNEDVPKSVVRMSTTLQSRLGFPQQVKIRQLTKKPIEAKTVILEILSQPLYTLEQQKEIIESVLHENIYDGQVVLVGEILSFLYTNSSSSHLMCNNKSTHSCRIQSINNLTSQQYFVLTHQTVFKWNSSIISLPSYTYPISLFFSSQRMLKEVYEQLLLSIQNSKLSNQPSTFVLHGKRGIGKRTLLQQTSGLVGCNYLLLQLDELTLEEINDIITPSCLPLIIGLDDIQEHSINQVNQVLHLLQQKCMNQFVIHYVHKQSFVTYNDKYHFFNKSIKTKHINNIKNIAKCYAQQNTIGSEIPEVYWDDIGGCEQVKTIIKQQVEMIMKNTEKNRGILLYGPPGTGKTLLAKAIATEYKMYFLYVGETERRIRQLFSTARLFKPAVVFFDEIDAIAGIRNGGGVFDRIVSQILSELQGVNNGGGVLVIAATNRIDMIDKSLLVPGRFDILIEIPLVSGDDRRNVLIAQLSKISNKDVDYDEIIKYLPEKLSGADIFGIVNGAYNIARGDVIKRYDNGENVTNDDIVVTQQHFIQILSNYSF